MGFLGVAAMLTERITKADLIAMVVFVPLSFIIGCVVGLPSIPFVSLCLRSKRLGASLPFVYGPSLIATAIHASHRSMSMDADQTALFALAIVCGLSVIGYFVLPRAPVVLTWTGRCPQCEYDLRGQAVAGCPECGWNRDPAASG